MIKMSKQTDGDTLYWEIGMRIGSTSVPLEIRASPGVLHCYREKMRRYGWKKSRRRKRQKDMQT